MKNKKIAVVVIHGIGSQCPGFADDLINEVSGRISKSGFNSEDVIWKSIYWADILELRQGSYLSKSKANNNLRCFKIRKKVVSALGDASAYQKVNNSSESTYAKIHNRICERLKGLYKNDLNKKSVPLLVVAHSLGGHIISNYIWDIQNKKAITMPNSDFEKFHSLAGIITFGCNIPLFTFAYDDVKPIEFPPKQLSADIKKKAKWLNYYDPQDVLAYPLKTINKCYDKVVDEDISINVGGILSFWNPLSHTKYWTDNSFTKPLAKFLTTFLRAIAP